MTNDELVRQMSPGESRPFDLEERTARFGEEVIDFVLSVRRNAVTSPIIGQLVRSATSIGANYCEADDAGSRKEFKYRIGLCRRESRETKFHLRMIVRAAKERVESARPLWKEAHELNLIFATIYRNTRDE